MRTVTFNTQIHDGLIKIPDRYKILETQNIEVMIFVKNAETGIKKKPSKTTKNARGILGKYKNPDLISKEKSAWETAASQPTENG